MIDHKSQTSLEAWRYLNESGTLTKRQKQACEVLATYGPSTGQEMAKYANCPGLWKRCSELEQAGLVYRHGVRMCLVTNRDTTEWALVTDEQAKQESIPFNRSRITWTKDIRQAVIRLGKATKEWQLSNKACAQAEMMGALDKLRDLAVLFTEQGN